MTGRGLRGRRLARLLLLVAFAVDLFLVYLYVAAPNFIEPMFHEPPSGLVWRMIPVVGIVLNLVGLAWMVRILRADPEGSRSWWRFDRY
jgi:Flp pilus assembly protein TadB